MKIDELIAYHQSEIDYLRLLKNIMDTGDCNTCLARKDCTEAPKIGQMVRYNCYAYVGKKERIHE